MSNKSLRNFDKAIYRLVVTGDWLELANHKLPILNPPFAIDYNLLYLVELTAIDNIPIGIEFVGLFTDYANIDNYDSKRFWESGIDYNFFTRRTNLQNN